MRRRIQRDQFGSPVVNDVTQNNAIFHVRTHHDRELARLSKGAKQDIGTTAEPMPNSTGNTSSTAGPTRRTRREVSMGAFALHQTAAVVPAHQQPTPSNQANDHPTPRFKIQVTEDKSGGRPTKILATLANGASLQIPEGLVKLTRSSFHTPTIREIGSNEDLCQLQNDQSGGGIEPSHAAHNLWGEAEVKTPDQTDKSSVQNTNNWNAAVMGRPINWNGAAEANQNNWKQADVRNPPTWNGTAMRNGNSWNQAAANSSNPWNQAVVRNSNQWNGAATNNPSHWTEAAVRNSNDWNDEVTIDQNNWPETVIKPSDHWHQNWPAEQDRRHVRHRSSSRRHRNPGPTRRERHNGWKMVRRQEPFDFQENRPESPPAGNPHPQEDSPSPSESDQRSEDTLIRKNEPRSNLYDHQTYQAKTRGSTRYPRSTGILKTPTPNHALPNQSNNVAFYNSDFYPRLQPFEPMTQIQRPEKRRCPTCHFGPCSTCKSCVCVECMATPCVSCGAPLCSACKTASCVTYSVALCTVCIYSQYMALRTQPYPAAAVTGAKFPPCEIPQCPPYNVMTPSYNPLSPCSPYIDWATRRNLPPLIPNFVCEPAVVGLCESTPTGDAYRAPLSRGNKFLDLFSKKQDTSSEDCSPCCRLQGGACVDQSLVYPAGWARHAPVQSPACQAMCCAHEAGTCGDLLQTILNVIWVVVPVLVFYFFVFHGLTHLTALNKFTRLAAVLASTTLLYIISLEPDDLILYPTDRPKVQRARGSLLAACAPCAPSVCPSPSANESCEPRGPDICQHATMLRR